MTNSNTFKYKNGVSFATKNKNHAKVWYTYIYFFTILIVKCTKDYRRTIHVGI